MFIDTYIAIPLWIFGIFGFIYFAMRVFDSLEFIHKKRKGMYTIVIATKNQEDTIEGVVRSLVLKSSLNIKNDRLLNIILVDMGSNDETPKIIERL